MRRPGIREDFLKIRDLLQSDRIALISNAGP